MILIADSGGSKTDWALVEEEKADNRQILKGRTQGLNPFHQSEDVILHALECELNPIFQVMDLKGGCVHTKDDVIEQITKIFFYGAGCTSETSYAMRKALMKHFPKAEVEVDSDLLGAARAVCGYEPGIACILGTGANSCLYDGKKITQNIPPLGYILGDEGSVAVLGKLFLNGIFKGSLSEDIKEKYLKWSGLTYPQIIDKVYRQPLANRFLAGISLFIKENLKYYELRDLVIYNFQCFFEKNVLCYPSDSIRTLSAVGGVASAFEGELRACAEHFNYKIGKVIDAPIDGLIGYYSETV